MDALLESGVVQPGGLTPMGGISGGAVTSVATCAGLTSRQQLEVYRTVSQKCSAFPTEMQRLTCNFNATNVLVDSLLDKINSVGGPNAYKRCAQATGVAVSVLNPGKSGNSSLFGSVPLVVRDFKSNEDMVHALGGSTFLVRQQWTQGIGAVVHNECCLTGLVWC